MMSDFGDKADIGRTYSDVCFRPKADISRTEQGALVPTFAAREYDRLQYGCLSLRANQRLQTRRGQHRHRRRAIRHTCFGGSVTFRLASTDAVRAPLAPSTSSAQGKASKLVVHYRDYPKREQMCGMCKFFEGRGMMGGGMGGGMMGRGMMSGDCEVVEGRISPMGWCDLYAHRTA